MSKDGSTAKLVNLQLKEMDQLITLLPIAMAMG